MPLRVRYVVAYDIRDSRRLRRVHQVVKDFGFPLQYSVFICDLTAVDLVGLRGALIQEAKLTEDSIAILDLGRPDGRGIDCIEFIGVRRALEDSAAAAIW